MRGSLFVYMDLKEALEKFRKREKRREWWECCAALYEEGRENYSYVKEFRSWLRPRVSSEEDMELLKRAWSLPAKDYFEDYLISMEWEREKKFYLPRRKGLKRVVDALQRLEDGDTDLLCISMPPGVGKTGTALFYLTWLAGRHPEEAILASSHNSSFLQGAYEECLRELKDSEYCWGEIFPHTVAGTNAKDLRIDIDKRKRFSTLQFSSIGAGNAGKVRAMQLLYCDDLIEGIEEALSKERLDSKWQKYTVDLRQRKQGNCKELHIATRWSVHDIIGRLETLHEGDDRSEFLKIPALSGEESNFDYGGSEGFTKEMLFDLRDTMDDASWRALYMNEPIEREGLLYHPDELRRFYSLPKGEPDAIIAICDTAEGGGDDTFLPVGYVYGEDHYIVDMVCSNASPTVTDELCAECLVRNNVQRAQFESNSAGGRTADKVQELVKEKGGHTHITKKRTTAKKETKIIVESTWVKEHCLFYDSSVCSKGYKQTVDKLCAWTQSGKNKHDDVPDGMAQYAQFARMFGIFEVKIEKRSLYGV